MPRRRRNWEKQVCYHITHRCHDREFRLRFAKYREMYRKYLFEATKRFNIRVLTWMVTSNHVHLLVTSGQRGEIQISEALQFVHGEVAQHYNLSRSCDGSFWSNRFYSTRIQNGSHLRRCLFYIDMNMVRAKNEIKHPAEWEHSSWQELFGGRKRYCIIDRDVLLNRLQLTSWDHFLEWYSATLDEVLANDRFRHRQVFWSSAAAVGDPDWLAHTAGQIGMRRFETTEGAGDDGFDLKTFFLSAKNSFKAN